MDGLIVSFDGFIGARLGTTDQLQVETAQASAYDTPSLTVGHFAQG
jgi:hypothetical protein